MAFSDLQLEDLRERSDIATILGKRVQLRKAGKDYVGLCPFHGERSPSFYVIPNKSMWHCFGCQEHGDIFKFFMKLDGMGFMDAIRHVSQESGIPIVEEQYDPEETKRRAHLEKIAELVERSVKFYESKLWANGGKAIREYITKRGVSEEYARKFHLGFAGTAMDDLSKALEKAGASPELAVEAGLCIQGRRGYFDRFHGRLITPIRIPRPPDGKSIAMGGRYLEGITDPPGKVLDRKPAKYINSPETPLYQKSHVLYGLDLARDSIRREERVVIVEGYFDVIGVHQAGLPLAVATCGTSLTASHLDLLARTAAKEIIFLFDGDNAGLRAAARAAEMCAKAQVPAKVATLPEGLDPDDFARQRGLDGLKALLERAKPAVELLIDHALKEAGPSPSVEERVRAVNSVKEIVLSSPDGLSRELYMAQLAERLNVPVAVVKQAIVGGKPGASSNAPVSQPPARGEYQASAPPIERPAIAIRVAAPDSRRQASRPEKTATSTTLDVELAIAASLLQTPALAGLVAKSGFLEDFESPYLRATVQRVFDAVQEDREPDVEASLTAIVEPTLNRRMRDAVQGERPSVENARAYLMTVLHKLNDLIHKRDMKKKHAERQDEGGALTGDDFVQLKAAHQARKQQLDEMARAA